MGRLWGAARTALYNDGYARIIGAKHPAALGHPIDETFPESRAASAPHLARAWAGEALLLADQPYPLDRGGAVEDAWFDIAYAPVRDASGAVGGILATMTETTARVLADRRREAAEVAVQERQRREAFL